MIIYYFSNYLLFNRAYYDIQLHLRAANINLYVYLYKMLMLNFNVSNFIYFQINESCMMNKRNTYTE
jgi:hypothetical protein